MKPVVVKIGGGHPGKPVHRGGPGPAPEGGGAPGGSPRGRRGGHPVADCYVLVLLARTTMKTSTKVTVIV